MLALPCSRVCCSVDQHLKISLPFLLGVWITASEYHEAQPLLCRWGTHPPRGVSLTPLCLLRMKNLSCGEVTDLAQGHTAGKLQCWALKSEPVSVRSPSVPRQRCWVRCSENTAFTLRNTWLLSSGLGTVKWTQGNTEAWLEKLSCLQENSRGTGCVNNG